MQIGKSRTSQDLWRLRKTKNEDSRGLMRVTRGKNFVPKFRGKLFEDEDLKRRKIRECGPRKRWHAPNAWFSMLSHALGTLAMRPVHFEKCWAQASFPAFLWVKPTILAQTQVETLTINTSLRHSEFFVQNCSISRERQF